jgi:DNA-binding NarL/FixJ family response regulator
MRTIVLADNQYITKTGWIFFIKGINPSYAFREASDKKELLGILIENPDALVILDYTLFDIGGINELQILQMRFERVDWILFSDELSAGFLRSLLQSTQSFSVLLKDCYREELLAAFNETIKGHRFICNRISNLLLENNANAGIKQEKLVLTATEQEILKDIALGRTTKEIASKRTISIHTVITHRKNIFRKIEVNNVHEATKYALRAGIVDMVEYNI